MVGKPGATSAKRAKESRKQEFYKHMAESALDTMRIWLEPFSPKFHSYGYTMMFMKLIISPGMKKSEIALFLENEARISRSTAERFIKDATDAGHIVVNNPPDKAGLEIFLSENLTNHFHTVFMSHLSRGSQRLELYGDLVS